MDMMRPFTEEEMQELIYHQRLDIERRHRARVEEFKKALLDIAAVKARANQKEALAEQERARAEQEIARAEQEIARAEQEVARAEQEIAWAKQEGARAEKALLEVEELKRQLELM